MKKRIKIWILISVLFLTGLSGCLGCQRTDEKEDEVQSEYEEETSICEIVRAMNFTVNEPNLNITPQENLVYLEAYLKVLKNEVPVVSKAGEQYYKDLWKSGIEFEELLREKETREYPWLYYYDDLDGDGRPELAIEQGCMFLFKYEVESGECRILYQAEACYFKKIVGAGQIWYHDGLHANVMRDSLLVLNNDGSFQEILSLEKSLDPQYPYFEVKVLNDDLPNFVNISEENWNEITTPFFDMVENNGLPLKTLEEVFGELLESGGEETVIANDKYFTIMEDGEQGYRYIIYNADGKEVKSGESYRVEPIISYIDEETIQIHIAAGTDTFYCIYYDIVNDRFSGQYESPVAAKYRRVAYLADKSGERVLIIEDMFDKSNCQEEFSLDFSPAVSPVLYAEFAGENILLITYLSGDSYEEKTKELGYGG